MKIVGRNEKCPCGNGLKYRECHGNLAHPDYQLQASTASLPTRTSFKEMSQKQDLGRKIVESGANNGSRIVAVGNGIHAIDSRITFHDFLINHLFYILEEQGFSNKQENPLRDQHPISIWRQKSQAARNSLSVPVGEVVNLPLNGANAALLNLAYDVYALKHNADFQKKLVHRLHDLNQFVGARYEVQVAATMARAGFSLEFEDEDNRQSTHCEFTATHLHSGKKYSVEAKKSVDSRNNSNRHVSQALLKSAHHKRIVFVDLNMPYLSSSMETPEFAKNAIRQLRRFELKDPEALKLPAAYIFLTNVSHEHHLDSEDWQFLVLTEGFKIKDYKMDCSFPSLLDEIRAHEEHKEMHDLHNSILMHTQPPIAFNKQCPPLAFGNINNRPAVGEIYLFRGPDGVEVEGRLTSANVMEHNKTVACEMVDAANKKFLVNKHFSDVEIATWRENPSGYFRKFIPAVTVRTMAQRYEYYMEHFRDLSKFQLLQKIRKHNDRATVAKMNHLEILKFISRQETENDVLELGPPPKTDFAYYPQRGAQ